MEPIALYLKFDPVQPSCYVWVPLMYDATPFDREADARSVKSKVLEASAVVVGEDSFYYVMKGRGSAQT
jgi:hypothetical protein